MGNTIEVLNEFGKKNVKILMRPLDKKTILIEGNKDALKFLAQLILAQIDEKDCGLQIGPAAAGSNFFESKSNLGLYIHRVPCVHKRKNK